MIIYRDLITNDELITDSYKMHDKGIYYEFPAKQIKISNNCDIDIGANPSAEGEDCEDLDDSEVTTVIDVVHACGLAKISDMTKASFKDHLKQYMMKLKKKLIAEGRYTEETYNADFKPKMGKFVKDHILAKFSTFDLYKGASGDEADSSFLFLEWREMEDGSEQPILIVFKDQIIEEKA